MAATCAAATMAFAGPVAAKDMIYSSFVSSEHLLTKNVAVPFTDELRERTGGEINFEVASGGALAGARETLEAVDNGTVDAGYIIDIYTPSALPQTALLSDLSLLIDNAVVATAAMTETVLLDCAECRESFEKHNVMPLGFVATAVYSLQCTTPVASLDDMQGLKVRATGAWAPLIEELGGTPVNVPTSELFEGLQRGALDCSVGPVSHLPSYSLYEVVTDINEMPIGAYAGGLPLNLRKSVWEDLTDEQRDIFLDLAPKYVAAGIMGYNGVNQESIDESKVQGINWHPKADDIVEVYDGYKKKVIAAAIEKGKADPSITDAEAMVNTYVENLEKWSAIIEEIGDTDAEALEAKLREEVYSKLK
tara:strand:+ start:6979 stop:8070 length:1092 start_codon:yes stop_codon:yes gene_type:complete